MTDACVKLMADACVVLICCCTRFPALFCTTCCCCCTYLQQYWSTTHVITQCDSVAYRAVAGALADGLVHQQTTCRNMLLPAAGGRPLTLQHSVLLLLLLLLPANAADHRCSFLL